MYSPRIVLIAAAVFFALAGAAQAQEREVSAKALECLALNVYWEARGEGRLGQEAVAHVTLNRVASDSFPNTICDVVKQEIQLGDDDKKVTCQFSWWCDGRPDTPAENAVWERARFIAGAVAAGQIDDPTSGALFFHHRRVAPTWIAQLHHTRTIGAHLFYR